MNISELNYLEVVSSETGNAVAGGGDITFNVFKDVDLNKTIDLNINKNVDVNVNITGLLATAEADAEAFGPNALAEVDAYALATRGAMNGGGPEQLATAYAESTAALNL